MNHTLREQDRTRDIYVVGAKQLGKTTFLLNCVIQDILLGKGVAFLDPRIGNSNAIHSVLRVRPMAAVWLTLGGSAQRNAYLPVRAIGKTVTRDDDPDAVVSRINSIGERLSEIGPLTDSDPFFPFFNRYSCALAREFAEHMQELDFHDREYARTRVFQDSRSSIQTGLQNLGENATERELDIRTRQLLYSAMLDRSLFEAVMESDPEERYVPCQHRFKTEPVRSVWTGATELTRRR